MVFGKGKHLSDELKNKISKATKKAMANPEIRKKISDAKKGRAPWNKGKKGVQISWNKGKTASIIAKRRMSVASRQKWLNPEYRKWMSKVHKGKPSPRKGTHPPLRRTPQHYAHALASHPLLPGSQLAGQFARCYPSNLHPLR